MTPPPARRFREPAEDVPSRETAWVLAGRGLVRGRIEPLEVGVDTDGFIAEIGKDLRGTPRRDVGDALILPSATDLHVHFRDPGGPEEVETVESGTRQAAFAGVGLVCDMPNTQPPIADADAIESKTARARGRSAVDLLLYASPLPAARIGRTARAAGAFKLYLSPTTGIEQAPEPSEVSACLAAVARTGLALTVHAEDPQAFQTSFPATDTAGWDRCRPPSAELRGIDRVLSGPPSLRLHVAHVTNVEAATRVRSAGHSFEVTANHLLLAARDGGNARFKLNPPLRPEPERARLWEAFRTGAVPIVASDHAPHPRDVKDGPFERAPSGLPGVETTFPLLLAQVRAGRLELETLVRAACDRPARWMGQPRGRLLPGHRADLVVVDFRRRTKLTGASLHAPCGWTPFEGWEAIFPREHFLLGERVVTDGEFVGRNEGRVVRPEYAPGIRTEPTE